jgi:hypothetical protein
MYAGSARLRNHETELLLDMLNNNPSLLKILNRGGRREPL